jgi:hypothetical protein
MWAEVKNRGSFSDATDAAPRGSSRPGSSIGAGAAVVATVPAGHARGVVRAVVVVPRGEVPYREDLPPPGRPARGRHHSLSYGPEPLILLGRTDIADCCLASRLQKLRWKLCVSGDGVNGAGGVKGGIG